MLLLSLLAAYHQLLAAGYRLLLVCVAATATCLVLLPIAAAGQGGDAMADVNDETADMSLHVGNLLRGSLEVGAILQAGCYASCMRLLAHAAASRLLSVADCRPLTVTACCCCCYLLAIDSEVLGPHGAELRTTSALALAERLRTRICVNACDVLGFAAT